MFCLFVDIYCYIYLIIFFHLVLLLFIIHVCIYLFIYLFMFIYFWCIHVFVRFLAHELLFQALCQYSKILVYTCVSTIFSSRSVIL